LSLLSYSCDRPSLPSFPTRRSSDLLVLLFAAYALVDGIFNIVAAVRAPREGRRWGWLLFSGVIGIATGLISFFWAGLTALALVLLVASWAVVTGVARIVAAVRLRQPIRHRGPWVLSAAPP